MTFAGQLSRQRVTLGKLVHMMRESLNNITLNLHTVSSLSFLTTFISWTAHPELPQLFSTTRWQHCLICQQTARTMQPVFII